MTEDANYTDALAGRVLALKRAVKDGAVCREARYRTLDWLGCAIGAVGRDSSEAARKVSSLYWPGEQATVIGAREKGSLLGAVFVNGVTGHKLEYDDVNKRAITHPGAVAIPVSLAVSECFRLDFDTFVYGVLAGYESMVRLGTDLNPSHYRFWHTTGSVGTLAAAAAAGALLGLDREALTRALGLAATMAAGLTNVFGTDAKLVNVGHAAGSGTLAALLAREGFTAPADVLNSPGGYAQAVSMAYPLDPGYGEVGGTQAMTESVYKIHASCGHTHSALDALLALREEHPFQPDEVAGVHVEAYRAAVELTGAFQHETESRAKFSLPYCMAAAVVFGVVDLSAFTPEALRDPRAAALGRLVTVTEDPESTALFPDLRRETVTVTLRDGRVWKKSVERSGGHPCPDFLEQKFEALARPVLGEGLSRKIKERVLTLDGHDSMQKFGDDLRRMMYNGMYHA